ncbi:HAD family hydrolase [bacterium]|nr:HAD family hydrolase [bacterium]
MLSPTNLIRSILNKKFWIFDLDGTLTIPVHDFPGIRKQLGVPDGMDILDHVSQQTEKKKKELLETLNSIEVKLADQSKPAEGTMELISTLNKNKVALGVITRNTKENAKVSLEKIGILSSFKENCILGREDAPPKPDPTGIRHLLSIWGVKPIEAVMVGDYLFDLQAGKAAGTSTIHVDYFNNNDWKNLTDIQIKSLKELIMMF